MRFLRFLRRLRLSSSRTVVHFLILGLFLRRYILPVPKLTRWPFTERMIFVKGRRMVVLSNHYIGLVPAGSQKDDLIWILKGGKVPFVLRRVSGEDCWELIGEAYIHGIMQGQAFNRRKLQTVSLR